jgi:hypothetical protein
MQQARRGKWGYDVDMTLVFSELALLGHSPASAGRRAEACQSKNEFNFRFL